MATPAPDKKNYATFLGSVIAPLSRGSVSILSPDMADPPLIDPEWLTHPTDQELAVAAMRRARQFLDTEAMRQVNPSGEAFPGSNVTSYKDLLAVVRSQTGTFYHASCTCKMGKENDEMAIVDSHARVYGVRNLRVVDASAFPFLPPGQPQATVRHSLSSRSTTTELIICRCTCLLKRLRTMFCVQHSLASLST